MPVCYISVVFIQVKHALQITNCYFSFFLKLEKNSWKEKEIRMVLIGRTGTGKSATGNTILGKPCFETSIAGSSVTRKCSQKSAVRFGQKILVVETPGIFDTKETNENIQREISKCISISSPGPHAFILVVGIARFTMEDQHSLQHFVDCFGENIFKYLIVLFTRKDDLDHEERSLEDHIKNVPQNLKSFIEKCGKRYIAFNNRLRGENGDEQVKDLLSMIIKNVKTNNGECYTNDMYEKAEKHLQIRVTEKRKTSLMRRDKELQDIENAISQGDLREQERHITKTAEEFEKSQEEIYKRLREELIGRYEREVAQDMIRDAVRNELELSLGVTEIVWNVIKSYFQWKS